MNLNLTTATRIGLNLLALLGVGVSLYLGARVFIPLTIALLLAAILWPAANWMTEKLHIPRFVACLSMVIGLVLAHLLVIGAFTVAIGRTVQELPKEEKDWAERYESIQRNLARLVPPGSLDKVLPEKAEDSGLFKYLRQFFQGDGVANMLGKLAMAGAENLFEAVLILFIVLFLLLEGQMLADKIRAIFGPSSDIQNRVSMALAEMGEAVRTYLVWRTIVNMGLTIVLGIVYHQAGIKYWYTWALLTGVLSYVPYIGTIAAGIPPIIDGLLFAGPEVALLILVFYTAVVTFEGYVIVPWVMGRSMDLNATTVLLACLFWQLVWGVAGLFLAMPLMAAVKAVCLQVDGWQGWGHLMSSEPAEPMQLIQDGPPRDLMGEKILDPEKTTVIENDHVPGGRRPGDSKSGHF